MLRHHLVLLEARLPRLQQAGRVRPCELTAPLGCGWVVLCCYQSNGEVLCCEAAQQAVRPVELVQQWHSRAPRTGCDVS